MQINIVLSPLSDKDKVHIYQQMMPYHFDSRNGLNNIIVGLDAYEIGEPQRLLHQLECILDIKMPFFDYWNEQMHEKELPIPIFVDFLEQLKARLIAQPDFYLQVNYRYINAEYLPNGWLADLDFLLEYCRLGLEYGATKLKYVDVSH